MTATAGQQEHPGVVAMRAHIETLESNVAYFRRCADATEDEREIERKIGELQQELAALRSRRSHAVTRLQEREAELAKARNTLLECQRRPSVAQLMWLKLLMERREPRKTS